MCSKFTVAAIYKYNAVDSRVGDIFWNLGCVFSTHIYFHQEVTRVLMSPRTLSFFPHPAKRNHLHVNFNAK